MNPPVRLPLQCELAVRWRDLDALGHVNSSVYATFLEEARIAFTQAHFPDVGTPDGRVPFILVHQALRYRVPLVLGDGVRVHMGVKGVGTTSFTFVYDLRRAADDAPVCDAETTIVWFDYAAGTKVPIPAAVRAVLESAVVAASG